jgi:hypothetical protein
MISLKECAEIAGLKAKEMILGVGLTKKHIRMLSSYLLTDDRGAAEVCGIIVADLRGYLDLGALRKSADLLIVLRLFLSQNPVTRRIEPFHFRWSGTAVDSLSRGIAYRGQSLNGASPVRRSGTPSQRASWPSNTS